MLKLSRSDRKQLREALTSGFRSYSALKRFVSDHFEAIRLNEIATSTAIATAADDLIEYFEESGGEVDLILALHQERPRNPEVQVLMNRLQGFLQQVMVLEPGMAEAIDLPFDLPEPYDDIQLESFLQPRLSYETDVKLLRQGLQLADAVCKVSFTDRTTTGTGVLVAPDLVLTNYHVLSKPVVERTRLIEISKTVLFEFGFVSEEHESPISPDTFAIAATDPVVACSPTPQLDYVLLRVEPKIKGAGYIRPVPIHSMPLLIAANDGLNILQHPQGGVMQVSLSASGIVQVDANRGRVWYVNRTKGGSSGSPCFSSKWEMVALHHASRSRSFGSIREGILLSSILTEISGFLA